MTEPPIWLPPNLHRKWTKATEEQRKTIKEDFERELMG